MSRPSAGQLVWWWIRELALVLYYLPGIVCLIVWALWIQLRGRPSPGDQA